MLQAGDLRGLEEKARGKTVKPTASLRRLESKRRAAWLQLATVSLTIRHLK